MTYRTLYKWIKFRLKKTSYKKLFQVSNNFIFDQQIIQLRFMQKSYQLVTLKRKQVREPATTVTADILFFFNRPFLFFEYVKCI